MFAMLGRLHVARQNLENIFLKNHFCLAFVSHSLYNYPQCVTVHHVHTMCLSEINKRSF
jgi:hypothetical protein